MLRHKDDFLQINEMPEINGIKIKWLQASGRMQDEDFKAAILAEKIVIETAKPKYIFADTLDMKFSIYPDLQEWHNKEIFPVFVKVNLRKLAVLVSSDLFTQVSIDQLIGEGKGGEMVTQYFEDEKKAIEWLKS